MKVGILVLYDVPTVFWACKRKPENVVADAAGIRAFNKLKQPTSSHMPLGDSHVNSTQPFSQAQRHCINAWQSPSKRWHFGVPQTGPKTIPHSRTALASRMAVIWIDPDFSETVLSMTAGDPDMGCSQKWKIVWPQIGGSISKVLLSRTERTGNFQSSRLYRVGFRLV